MTAKLVVSFRAVIQPTTVFLRCCMSILVSSDRVPLFDLNSSRLSQPSPVPPPNLVCPSQGNVFQDAENDKSVHPAVLQEVKAQKQRCFEYQERFQARKSLLTERKTGFYNSILKKLQWNQKRIGQPAVKMSIDQVKFLVDTVFERQSVATVWDIQMRERKLQTQLRQEVLVQQNAYYYNHPEIDPRSEREQVETRFLVDMIQNGRANIIQTYFGDIGPSPFGNTPINAASSIQRSISTKASQKRKRGDATTTSSSQKKPLLGPQCTREAEEGSLALLPIYLNLPFCEFTNAMLVTVAESRQLMAPLYKFKHISPSSPSSPLFDYSFPSSLQIFASSFLDFARAKRTIHEGNSTACPPSVTSSVPIATRCSTSSFSPSFSFPSSFSISPPSVPLFQSLPPVPSTSVVTSPLAQTVASTLRVDKPQVVKPIQSVSISPIVVIDKTKQISKTVPISMTSTGWSKQTMIPSILTLPSNSTFLPESTHRAIPKR